MKDMIKVRNDYNRENYDRIGLMLPKGRKEAIKAFAVQHNMSINELFITAVNAYMTNCAICAKNENNTDIKK